MPSERDLVLLEVDGPIAVITNNRPDKHNAMSDEMDRRLWEVLAEVHGMNELRAIVWRGEGRSFSSGRDTTQLGPAGRGHLRPRVHRAGPSTDPDVPDHALPDHLRPQGMGHRRGVRKGPALRHPGGCRRAPG